MCKGMHTLSTVCKPRAYPALQPLDQAWDVVPGRRRLDSFDGVSPLPELVPPVWCSEAAFLPLPAKPLTDVDTAILARHLLNKPTTLVEQEPLAGDADQEQ